MVRPKGADRHIGLILQVELDCRGLVMKVRTLLGIVVATALVHGCGGGGGGSNNVTLTPTLPIAIDGGNAESIVGAGVGFVLTTADTADQAATLALGVKGETPKRRVNLAAFMRNQLQWLFQASGEQLLISANTVLAMDSTKIVNCVNNPTGQITATFSDNDNNGAVSTGDAVTLAFTDCQIDATDPTTVQGAITMANFQVTGDPTIDTSPWYATTAVGISNLVFQDTGFSETIDGGFTFNEGTPDNVNYTEMLSNTTLTDQYSGSTDKLMNFSMTITVDNNTSAYTLSAAGTYSSTALGGTISLSTPAALSGVGTANPNAGTMKLVGDSNSSVTVTPLDATNVRLEVDSNGDGSSDATIDTTWTALTG